MVENNKKSTYLVMKKCFFLCLLFFGLTATMLAQKAHEELRKGDKAYESQDYNEAETKYRKAIEADQQSAKGSYNLGNAIYRQGDRYEEAANHFQKATENMGTAEERAKAYYNLGNAHFLNEDLDKSLEAYKQSLRLDPNDEDTKYNLSFVKKRIQQQQQQEQQQEQQESDEEKENDEEQEQQQEQDQENQDEPKDDQEKEEQENEPSEDEEEKDQENEGEGEEEEEQEEEQPQEQPKDLSKEEAQKLLDIIDEEEKKVQEKIRKATGKPTPSKKDW